MRGLANRPRGRLLALLLVLAAVVSVTLWLRREAPPPAQPGQLLVGAASAEEWMTIATADAAPGYPAMLATDRRRRGELPFSFRPAPGAAAELRIQLRNQLPLLGAWVTWDGSAPAISTLSIGDDGQLTSPSSDRQGGSLFIAATPTTASSVVLRWEPQAGTHGVAELTPLVMSASTWLVAPAARIDRDSEILTTYGIPDHVLVPPAALEKLAASSVRTIVVSNAPLTVSQTRLLRARVQAGAQLIELGPLAGVCGPAVTTERASDASRATWALEGLGLDGARLVGRIEVLSDCSVESCVDARIEVTATRRVARGESAQSRPAVVSSLRGDGSCWRWLTDVADAIQTLRQGDPALATLPGAASVLKPADLFGSQLGATDYDVPSADRLGRALAGQLARTPGPDLLVDALPDAAAGLAIFTADQDFVPAMGVLAHSEAVGSAGLTIILTAADIGATPNVVFDDGDEGLMAVELVGRLAQRGHGVGIHPNLVGLPVEKYGEVIIAHARAFERTYGVRARLVRNHHVIWAGYVDMARYQAQAGLVMSLDFVTLRRSAAFRPGFMTGSGLPMRFVDRRGFVLPILQQATQLDDHVLIPGSDAGGPAVLQRLVDRTTELLNIGVRERIPVTFLHHPQWWHATEGRWQAAFLDKARDLAIPVWGAGRWLRFTEALRQTRVRYDAAHPGTVIVTTQAEGATLLVEGAGRVFVNGSEATLGRQVTLGGVNYRLLAVGLGTTTLRLWPADD